VKLQAYNFSNSKNLLKIFNIQNLVVNKVNPVSDNYSNNKRIKNTFKSMITVPTGINYTTNINKAVKLVKGKDSKIYFFLKLSYFTDQNQINSFAIQNDNLLSTSTIKLTTGISNNLNCNFSLITSSIIKIGITEYINNANLPNN